MVLIPMSAFAATIIVDDDGPAAYRSIQRAIDAAAPGDVIKVAEGLYEEHIEIRKNVHLIGAGPDKTQIEFSREIATVLIKEVTDVVVRGFTIAYAGPEINDSFRAALWINNGTCAISENHITGSGRGILCTDSANVQITGNLIYWNKLNGVSGYSKVRITRLSDNEISRLRSAIIGVLRKGIRNAGASFSDYRRPSGDKGSQQDAFHVAHRGGETCSVCATPIERIPVRNRGTYYCPKCQGNATCSGSSASSSP